MAGQVGPFIANMTVEGPVATGNPGGNPQLIGVIDGNGNVQSLKGDTSGNVSTSAFAPALSTYALTSVSGTATLSGYFVDSSGVQQSALQTFSITAATTLTALYNAANSISPSTTPLPSNFAGFKASLSGSAVYVGNGGNADGTIAGGYSPAAGYPQIATQNYLTFGKV